MTFSLVSFGQEKKELISIAFKDVNLKTIIENLENTTKYKFFFQEDWTNPLVELISGDYQEKTIDFILDDVFKNTTLNYFLYEDKIILTKNSIIYDKLPDNYFGNLEIDNAKASTEKPIFFNETENSKINENIVLIGKENNKTEKKLYELSGILKNTKTGEPIPDIIVKVRGKNIKTTTNNDGFYILQLPLGQNTIETESFNHKKFVKNIMVYNNGKLNISINENINNLDEVVVKAKEARVSQTTVTGVTTIDIEGIKNVPLILGERDIFKVATTLPGVKTTGEGSAGFNVRGGKEDQNLILLDNAVIYNPSHFLGFFSAVNPFTTKKANIYKGSIPAEFGGRLSSVFDITSKNGKTDKLAGEGGIGPVTSNLAISTPIIKDKSSLLVGGRGTYSGWILKSLKEETLKKSEASFYDGLIKYNHKFNLKNNFETTLYYSHDAFSISSDSLYKYSNRLLSMKWDHNYNKKNKSSVIVTNSEYKFNIDYDTPSLNAFDFGYKINETQFLLKMNYSPNEKHKFNYGFASKLYNINPGYLDPKKENSPLIPITLDSEKGLESAVYLSDSYKPNEKLAIDFGFRYSLYANLGSSSQKIYQSNVPKSDATVLEVKEFGNNEVVKTYSGFEPRLALRYYLANDFSVKGSFDTTNQYIHLLSSNTTQSPTDTWKLSDLNVKPQTSKQYSIGFYKNITKSDLELSIEGYFKQSKNILDYKVAAQLLLNENLETQLLQGIGKAYGIEFLLKKDAGRLNGWLGYTYSRTFIKLDSKFNDEKVNNGAYFAANFDKPHDFSMVLNYRITKRYSFSSNFVYQTGRPITYPIGKYTYGNAEYTLYSDRNKFRIPDYYRLDIGFNVEGNHKIKKLAHSFWNVSIYNLLGRNNPYSIYFITEKGQVKAFKTSIFAIPVPTITYNFKF